MGIAEHTGTLNWRLRRSWKRSCGSAATRLRALSGTVRFYDFQGLESDLAILVLPVTENQVVLAGGVTLPHEDHLNRVLYTGMSRATTMLIIVAHESYRGILENRRERYDKLVGSTG